MTDVPVLVPYSRFLECRQRRRAIAAELPPGGQPPTIDVDVIPAPREAAVAQSPIGHHAER